METGTRCLKCHRPLRAAASRERGVGPVCFRRARRGLVVLGSEKAIELLRDGALQPLRGLRVVVCVSSDGTRWYRTSLNACTCPHGVYRQGSIHSRPCYHQLALAALQRLPILKLSDLVVS